MMPSKEMWSDVVIISEGIFVCVFRTKPLYSHTIVSDLDNTQNLTI